MEKKMSRLMTGICLTLLVLVCTGCTGMQTGSNLDTGMTALESQDYEGALASFEQAIVKGEDHRLVYRGQGLAYMGLTQYEDATAAFEKSLVKSDMLPDDLDYDINYYLAVAYYKSGELKKAMEVYDAIIDLSPRQEAAYSLRGSIELELQDYDSAIKDFDEALKLAPENYDELIRIYEAMDKNGYKEAGQTYLQAALDNGDKKMRDFDRGRISYYLGDYETARNKLEAARDSDGREAAYYLGKTWEALGDYNYAASVYSSYISENSEDAKIYNQLALCKMKLGEYDAALAAVQAAIAIENNGMNQTLEYNEIVIYENLGDFQKANVLMQTYMQKYPDDADATREYQFLQTRA